MRFFLRLLRLKLLDLSFRFATKEPQFTQLLADLLVSVINGGVHDFLNDGRQITRSKLVNHLVTLAEHVSASALVSGSELSFRCGFARFFFFDELHGRCGGFLLFF